MHDTLDATTRTAQKLNTHHSGLHINEKAPISGAFNLLVPKENALLAREAGLCAEANSRPFHESEIAVVELARHGVGVDAHTDDRMQAHLVISVHDELATSQCGVDVDFCDTFQLHN